MFVSIEDRYQVSLLHNGLKPRFCRNIPQHLSTSHLELNSLLFYPFHFHISNLAQHPNHDDDLQIRASATRFESGTHQNRDPWLQIDSRGIQTSTLNSQPKAHPPCGRQTSRRRISLSRVPPNALLTTLRSGYLPTNSPQRQPLS